MTRLLPDVFYANKYQPWLSEKYGDAWDNPTDKAKSAKTAMLFSRANTLLSFPMLLSMVAAQNLY